MKRLIAFFISILLIFSLCCCGGTVPNEEGNIPAGNGETIIETPNSFDQTPDTPDSPASPNETPNDTPNTPGTEGGGTTTPTTPPEKEEIKIPDVNDIVTDHTALKKESYYQYSFLNDAEKSIYNDFYSAAEKCQSIIDLDKYKLKEDAVKKVYSAFVADCPQYFYISRHSTFIVDSKSKFVTQFIIRYTDGEKIDDFDDKNNPIVTADRQKIKNQITEFSGKISAILSHIPSNVSELERERRIYDYIAETVIYDHEAENNSKNNSESLSPSFSAYGAACKGKAVCEGYVKLFQYLCYNSGINVTPVESDSKMQHMWASVKIDNNWYMTDITWDDSDDELGCLYKYFNVTKEFLSRDHTFGESLKIPPCTATSAAFYNNFAITANGNRLPDNYKDLVKNALTRSDKYLYVYRDTDSKNLKEFLNQNIFIGEFSSYLNQLGYTTGEQYYHTDTYYFIPIIKK